MAGKALVVVYSLTGSTRRLGKVMAKRLGADYVDISPVKPYSPPGFMTYLIGGMQSTLNITPAIKPLNKDLSKYDLVIIGTPVWASKMAPPVRSFMKAHDLTGKKVALFCTYRGGAGRCTKGMKQVTNGNVVAESGFKMLPSTETESIEKAKQWAASLLPNAAN